MLYNVTLKQDAHPDELEKAKDIATSQGGKITHEFSLIKGFVVEYPDDHVGVLKSNEYIDVEQDSVVKTQ